MIYSRIFRRILMGSGMLAVLVYLVHVVLGGVLWKGYSHLHQPISDLTATGAPNRSLLLKLTNFYGALALIFAISFSFFESKKHHKLVFWGAISFVVLHIVSISYGCFPQDLPGSEMTFSGTMHLIVTALIIPFTILTPLLIGFGFIREQSLKAFGKYSVLTGILIFLFGGTTAIFFINKLPYFGVAERLNIGVLQIWTFCLSFKLYFTKRPA